MWMEFVGGLRNEKGIIQSGTYFKNKEITEMF